MTPADTFVETPVAKIKASAIVRSLSFKLSIDIPLIGSDLKPKNLARHNTPKFVRRRKIHRVTDKTTEERPAQTLAKNTSQ